jgi:bleomycin hydrolase
MFFCKRVFAVAILIPFVVLAQNKKEKKEDYDFNPVYQIKTTKVRDQAKTETCWSFATTSFIETELLRMKKGEHLLSTMFNVRLAYLSKAENYIRYAGSTHYGNGGQAHDVMDVVKNYGFVPEEIYSGMKIDEENHNHGEMDALLKAILDATLKNKGGAITPLWKNVFESTLNIYLGTPPKEFIYLGKEYSPKSFADHFNFNTNDYVEITSFTHRPFYSKFVLEVPDNWSRAEYYNLPINEMINLIDTALSRGYSVVWDGDTSEKTFNRKKGLAIIPAMEEVSDENTVDIKDEDAKLVREKFITQDMRQEAFENHTTTDDHLMHIVGLARDQRGYKFYYIKDSFGTTNKKYGGFIYMSEIYARLKTIAIMVHKDSIPMKIKTKLGI